MKILVAIDDTDNLESRGTGALAGLMTRNLEQENWGSPSFISRHQLLVHPDVPYTSHNSVMCFAADIRDDLLDRVIEYGAAFLTAESAPGSDPGLCVAVVSEIRDISPLIAFGRQAKTSVLKKENAYSLAREWGIHLSEHGGTGQGVIGALAGVGLRLSGNDGRLRGSLFPDRKNDIVTVADLCRHEYIDCVQSLAGIPLDDGEQVQLGEKVKTVFHGGRSILLVTPLDASPAGVAWQTCDKQQLKIY